MYGSTKSTLQSHGGIQGCRFGEIGFFFSSEVLGVSMEGFAGDPLSIILRGVRKAVEIPTASSAIIFMSLL